MAITRAQRQRPAVKDHRRGQRINTRRYPPGGTEWGQEGWGSSGTGVPATGATAGIPGTWTPPGSTPPSGPGAPMVGIVATPATAWTSGQYVQTATIGAAGRVTWSGSAWVGGVAPLFDPGEYNIDEVKDHVNGLAMDDQRDDLIQAILDLERANKNRSTLVTWLDQQLGVV